MESIVKLQTEDATTGLFEWQRKKLCAYANLNYMLLEDIGYNNSGVVQEDLDNSSSSMIYFDGMIEAKEWNFSSAIAGYGFDITWATGKLWSFLVENEVACRGWVQLINESIKCHSSSNQADKEEDSFDPAVSTNLDATNSLIKKSRRYDGNISEGVTDDNADTVFGMNPTMSSTQSFLPKFTHQNLFHDTNFIEPRDSTQQRSTLDQTLDHTHDPRTSDTYLSNMETDLNQSMKRTMNLNSTLGDKSMITFRRGLSNPQMSISKVNDLDPIIQFSGKVSNESTLPTIPNDQKAVNRSATQMDWTAPLDGNHAMNPLMDRWKEQSNMDYGSNLIKLPDSGLIHYNANEIELLKQIVQLKARVQELDQVVDQKQKTLDTTHKQHQTVVQTMERQVDQLQSLNESLQRESNHWKDSKSVMESKLIQATNDNQEFYEANLKALRLQHKREMDCLREELEIERKRFGALSEQYTKLTSTYNHQIQSYQNDIESLRDQMTSLQINSQKIQDQLQNETSQKDRESKKIISLNENKLEILMKEKKMMEENFAKKFEDKLNENQNNILESYEKIKKSEMNQLKHELEGQKIRSLTELQRRCSEEIEEVRTEERRQSALELDKVRNQYIQREHQTAADLLELEQLHETRIQQLDGSIQQEKIKNEKLRNELQTFRNQWIYEKENLEKKLNESLQQLSNQSKHSQKFSEDISGYYQQLQEYKHRETVYREQCSKLMEECRLQRSELLEAKQQLSTYHSQIDQWKSVHKQAELSLQAIESTHQIAKDEIYMLENEIKRLKDENFALRNDVSKADRLIYGVSQHGPDSLTNTSTMKINNHQLCYSHEKALPPTRDRLIHYDPLRSTFMGKKAVRTRGKENAGIKASRGKIETVVSSTTSKTKSTMASPTTDRWIEYTPSQLYFNKTHRIY